MTINLFNLSTIGTITNVFKWNIFTFAFIMFIKILLTIMVDSMSNDNFSFDSFVIYNLYMLDYLLRNLGIIAAVYFVEAKQIEEYCH